MTAGRTHCFRCGSAGVARPVRFVEKVGPQSTMACESCGADTPLTWLSIVEPEGSLTEWWCPACVVASCDLKTVPIRVQREGGVAV